MSEIADSGVAGSPEPPPTGASQAVRYRLDPGPSRFTVQAFAAGLLSFLGHSPTFAVRDFRGEAWFHDSRFEHGGLRVTVRADSLELLDQVKPADRTDIERRMRGEVLETAVYPEIRYEATARAVGKVADHQYRLLVNGRLALHGVTNPLGVEVQLRVYNDGIRLAGEFGLQMSDYRIRPVTALGGTIRLKEQLRVAFDIVGWKEG
jgi:polyisoprenoid-binding protein YceI